MKIDLIAYDTTYGLGRYTKKFYEDMKKISKKELFVYVKNYPTKNTDSVSLFVEIVIKGK